MTEFFSIILNFPTLLYTGLLGLTLFYWLLSMVGLADFDFDGGNLDGIDVTESPLLAEGVDAVDSSGFLSKFKLDGIPFTISLSLVIFLSWVISFLLVHYYQSEVTDGWVKILVGVWVVILAPVISAPIIGILLNPLKPAFQRIQKETEGRKADSLVGHIAIVRTDKVNMSFGDADINSDGASLILKVRAAEPNIIRRGDRVLITKYHSADNVFMVKRQS